MFLVAVTATAENGKATFTQILGLRNEVEQQLLAMGRRAENGQKLLALLYRRPTVNISAVSKELGISQVAADKLVKTFPVDRLFMLTHYRSVI
jgi:hypothetical protein